MNKKVNKKDYIRRQIIAASHIYSNNFAGKVFLYVFGDNYFEVLFKTDRFMHLTGVNSNLDAQDFYKKAKDSKLTTNQIYFDSRHPYYTAKKKLPCLLALTSLTDNLVCVVNDLHTRTLTYKIGVTNLEFTVGLTENVDFNGNKINEWFLPRTLRVKDKAIENSRYAEFIDFIFCKDATNDKYDTVTYFQQDKNPPTFLKDLLSESLLAKIF